MTLRYFIWFRRSELFWTIYAFLPSHSPLRHGSPTKLIQRKKKKRSGFIVPIMKTNDPPVHPIFQPGHSEPQMDRTRPRGSNRFSLMNLATSKWNCCLPLDNRLSYQVNLPPLCAAILKPSLHLSVSHFEAFGESSPFSRG